MQQILKSIKPSTIEENKFTKTYTNFLTKLNKNLKSINANAIIGGSTAKGTWLSDNHDADIFVLFNLEQYKDKSSKLSDILEPILKKTFKNTNISRVHGSRDYFQMLIENYNFEVVPILKIENSKQAINITDVSPLHAKWVNKNSNLKLKDEIRLLKKFCKANELYGAESHIGGFSGYILEILTIHFESFENTLQAATKFKIKQVIDAQNLYPKKDALFHLNKSKTTSPIIIIDPVDMTRNAAAALGQEKLNQLKKVAKAYLKTKTKEEKLQFFKDKDYSFKSLSTQLKNLIYITLTLKEGKSDVIGYKVVKTIEHLKRSLINFEIKKSGFKILNNKENQAIVYLTLKKTTLPKEMIRSGPPLKLTDSVKAFKTKYKNTFEEDSKIKAKITIKDRDIKTLLPKVLEHKYIKEKIKNIQKIQYN
jgi:tRNA nucleotidyltransferase (CCA-adding enzyme)